MTFSSKLQKLRKDNNLSQEELARKLNVSRQAISKWELGTLPDINNLVRISQYFDCSIDYLINDNTENTTLATNSKKIDLPLVLSTGILVISILVLVLINICSIINPAPIVQQASDGSWYVGLTGFIYYHSLQGLMFFLFISVFSSFSMIIFSSLIRGSKQESIINKGNNRILFGYSIMMVHGILYFYEIMTSSYFHMDIPETLFTLLINVLGIRLIITGFRKKKGLLLNEKYNL